MNVYDSAEFKLALRLCFTFSKVNKYSKDNDNESNKIKLNTNGVHHFTGNFWDTK